MAPPNDLFTPVEPVGVDTQTPSPLKFSNNSPLINTSHTRVPFTFLNVASFKAMWFSIVPSAFSKVTSNRG